jgi:hypothetical protein
MHLSTLTAGEEGEKEKGESDVMGSSSYSSCFAAVARPAKSADSHENELGKKERRLDSFTFPLVTPVS